METTLRIVKTVLDRTPGVQGYALIGGMAMGAWIAPRKTMDVDILVHVNKRSQPIVERIRSRLLARGWSVAAYTHEHPSIPHRLRAMTQKGLMADLIFAPFSLHKEIIEGSESVRIGKRLRFPVAGPEAIIVLKLIGGRRQDLMDVERLLTEAEIDEKLLHRLARKAKVEKDLLRTAKRA